MLQCSRLFIIFSRGILSAPSNSSKKNLFFFIVYTQLFLSKRGHALIHPHHCIFSSLKMIKLHLETTFTQWDGYKSKYDGEIYLSSFYFDDFSTFPQGALYGCSVIVTYDDIKNKTAMAE